MKDKELHNIKKTGFNTPKDYFESFDERLFERLDEDIKIAEIDAPGFQVPETYFDTLETSILNKLNNANNTPVITLKSRRTWYYIAGMAASILLLLAIFINKPNTEEFSVEMVESYFTDADLDTYELAELLSDADVLDADFTIIATEYNEDNLEEYLLEHSDIESILE